MVSQLASDLDEAEGQLALKNLPHDCQDLPFDQGRTLVAQWGRVVKLGF